MMAALRSDDVNDMLDALSCFFANIPANITVKREKYYQTLVGAAFDAEMRNLSDRRIEVAG